MAKDFKKIFLSILGWFFGIILILASFGNFIDYSLIAGTIFLIIALFVLPPSRKFLKEKLNIDLSRGIEITFIYLKKLKSNLNSSPPLFSGNKKVKSKILIERKEHSGMGRIINKTQMNNRTKIGGAIIIIIAVLVIYSLIFPSEITTKRQAYVKCLQKTKECSGGIPAVRLELMSECNQIYMYTDEASGMEQLLKITKDMC